MTEDWQDQHVRAGITQVVIYGVGVGDVDRPRKPKAFEKVKGIRTSYGFMVIGTDGAVALRGFDCWCRSCIGAVGRSDGTMDAICRVSGCKSAPTHPHWNQYYECQYYWILVHHQPPSPA